MVAYLPAAERIEIIRAYARQYNIKKFIESGTANGDTPAALLDEFNEIVTIELDKNLYAAACGRFFTHPKVHCLHGDSGKLLPSIISEINEPIIFWLDGHYCGGARAEDTDTPIIAELNAAVKAPQGSVILIDDARLFGGMPEHTEEFQDYPDVQWIKALATENNFFFFLEDDIMRLVDKDKYLGV